MQPSSDSIQIWPYQSAPPDLVAGARGHGGDEDWLILVPATQRRAFEEHFGVGVLVHAAPPCDPDTLDGAPCRDASHQPQWSPGWMWVYGVEWVYGSALYVTAHA